MKVYDVLTQSDVLKQSLEYLPNGNIDTNGKINSTSGLGKYYYEEIPDHAVSGIDNTDNIVSTDPQEIFYTSFNKVNLITEGNVGTANYRTLQYLYGPDQQRRRTVFTNGSLQKTTYFIGSYEKEITGSTTRELHYIGGGDGLAAVYIKTNGTGALYYILKDHLGSIQFICSETGQKLEEFSFDAWGRRRNPADYTDFNVATSNYLTRGFTGHEHLNAFNLIDMNGRVYDPVLCRFLSPDPYVQMPGFTQSFNRYSYCLNNPLIFTDPSGELWNLLLVWGGNYEINWLDNTINKKMSPKQAFNQTPIMVNGNFSPSDRKWSNSQVDAFNAVVNQERIWKQLKEVETKWSGVGYKDVTSEFNAQLEKTMGYFTIARGVFDINNDFDKEFDKLIFFWSKVTDDAVFDIKKTAFSRANLGAEYGIYRGQQFRYDDFGNYNYGVAARYFGYSLEIALFGAGMNQIKKLNPDFSNPGGYFDHLHDTEMIIKGYNHKW